jgi:hypothetical protein
MTDLIKALRERREELRNELQEHPSFQEYELVCRLLERREASVSIPSSLRPKAPQRKPAPRRKPAPQQQPVDRPAPFTRTDRGMNAVIEASADFLRRKGARADSGRDPEGVGPVRHPRGRSARSVEDHLVPRPRQGDVRQRPWRGVRVEGVAAVRLNQRRSEKWREKDSWPRFYIQASANEFSEFRANQMVRMPALVIYCRDKFLDEIKPA